MQSKQTMRPQWKELVDIVVFSLEDAQREDARWADHNLVWSLGGSLLNESFKRR
jgi:hypothetical protein